MVVRRTVRDRKPEGYQKLFNIDANAKTIKGRKIKYIDPKTGRKYRGCMTLILYLAPSDSSGVINVCTFAGLCKHPCLNTSGRGQFAATQRARIRKTIFLANNRDAFVNSLRYEIRKAIRYARARRLKLCVRVNGTSDLPWIAMQFASEFPDIQFYDYTKCPKPELRMRPNYWITFSHDGPGNIAECLRVLNIRVNVSVVFRVKKDQPLPETWNGYQVIDGDLHDLRFLDPRGDKGIVVGLRAKGRAKKNCSAFVVNPGANPNPNPHPNFVPLAFIKPLKAA